MHLDMHQGESSSQETPGSDNSGALLPPRAAPGELLTLYLPKNEPQKLRQGGCSSCQGSLWWASLLLLPVGPIRPSWSSNLELCREALIVGHKIVEFSNSLSQETGFLLSKRLGSPAGVARGAPVCGVGEDLVCSGVEEVFDLG